MDRVLQLATFSLGDFLFAPNNDSFFKTATGLLVVGYGAIAICAIAKDDVKRARTSLFAAVGLILLIEMFSPLDWSLFAR
jgi:hypothetical protein